MNAAAKVQWELEQTVLALCSQDADARNVALDLIGEGDFTAADAATVWIAIREHPPGPDLAIALARTDLRPEWVAGLMRDWYGSPANIGGYCGKLVEASRVRMLHAACREALEAEEGPDEIVGRLISAATGIVARRGSDALRWSAAYTEAGQMIADAQAKHRAGGKLGLTFGLPTVDHILGGLHGPRLMILAARPSCGKTAVLNQFALRNAARGSGGMIFSLEMGRDELVVRGMALAGDVVLSRLLRGTASAAEVSQATDAMTKLGDIPLWIDTDTYNLDAISARATVAKARHGIGWIAVDHMGLVETPRMPSRNEQMGLISRSLKQLAKRLDIPVIAVSQLNRACDTDNRRPGLADLRDSGNIEQDADIVMMLHCDKDDRSKNKRPISIGFPKNRVGPAVWPDADFEFDALTQRFRELERVHEDADNYQE